MRNIKAIIFDFDGTLVSSFEVWTKFINPEFYSKWNIDENKIDYEKVKSMSFSANSQYIAELFELPISVEEIEEERIEIAKHHFGYTVPLKEGVVEFIKKAFDSNIILAIASNNIRELINECLNSNGILDKFTEICTFEEVKRPKPFPDIFLKIAEKLRVRPDECLVFEDALEGILAAKAAGMMVVGVYDRFNSKSEKEILKNSDRYVLNFNEIMDIFEASKIG